MPRLKKDVRKTTQMPKKGRRKTPFDREITRREVLKVMGSVASVLLIGSSVRGMRRRKKTRDLNQLHLPLRTALRDGRSVKEVVEQFPGITEREMAFFKKKGEAGVIWTATTDEHRDRHTVTGFYPGNARSRIHTHLGAVDKEIPDTVEKKRRSMQSSFDVKGLVGYSTNRKPDGSFPSLLRDLRTGHVLPVNPSGNIPGYFSIRISKKLADDPKALVEIETWARRMGTKMGNEVYRKEWDALEKSYGSLLQSLQTLREKGLNIRMTPLPGYVFKDGYFQRKMKK